MKRPLPFAVLFALFLVLVSLLPLYVEQTMTRVMFVGGQGDTIEWGWKLCTLRTFVADYRYFRRYPHPEFWIAMNIALACAYALALAFLARRLLRQKSNAA